MKRPHLILLSVTGVLLLLLLVFLAGAMFGSRPNPDPGDGTKGGTEPTTPPGTTVTVEELKDPPPPPKKVANPNRVRSNLQAGKTYHTHTKGTLHVRGEDRNWGLGTVITINYAFEAFIDRHIESNDGTQVVELRHFKDVRALKVNSRLEELKIELGAAGDVLFAGLSALSGLWAPAGKAAGALHAVDGLSLRPALGALRFAGVSPEQLSGLDQSAVQMTTQVQKISGKKVRLTFVDGKGVTRVEPIQGEMTSAERDFHFASSLLSDSLIIPNVDIKPGIQWSVDGSNFANLLDPGLLARTGGMVPLERAADHLVGEKICRQVRVVGGRITLDQSTTQKGQVGHFDPEGAMFFDPEQQVFIRTQLRGKGELLQFSKDHLLFETRMRRHPELEILSTCRVGSN